MWHCNQGNIVAAHYQHLVLPDLSKAKAYEYFLSLVESLPVACQDLFGKGIESFEKVYHMTGGRMIFIDLDVSAVKKAGALLPGPDYCHFAFEIIINFLFSSSKQVLSVRGEVSATHATELSVDRPGFLAK